MVSEIVVLERFDQRRDGGLSVRADLAQGAHGVLLHFGVFVFQRLKQGRNGVLGRLADFSQGVSRILADGLVLVLEGVVQ